MLLELAVDRLDGLPTEAHDVRADVGHPCFMLTDEYVERGAGCRASIVGRIAGVLGRGVYAVLAGKGAGASAKILTRRPFASVQRALRRQPPQLDRA